MFKSQADVTVIGAGLVGSLLSIFLARRGFAVDLIERRPDMRKHAISAGRSINLAISTRGITALSKLGLDREVLAQAIPMKGRMMHAQTGELSFQPYGTHDFEYLNSISRATLNTILINHAESTGKVNIRFSTRVSDIDFDRRELKVVDESRNQSMTHGYEIVIGTDGSASAVRAAMEASGVCKAHSSMLDYGYKELVIPPSAKGDFLLERNALHIWPRGNYMLIALPNFEGSFTCTLFLPFKGPLSFEQITTPDAAEKFFKDQFPDATPLIAELKTNFEQNPTGHMTTVKCERWNVEGDILLMGDAAHAIVPFFGQGMNCGFEDCTILDEQFDKHMNGGKVDWRSLFDAMTELRVINANAIADMAVENFFEMRDKVGDKKFLMEKAVENILQKTFPGHYVSRYALVTFSNVPYKFAQQVGEACDVVLGRLCKNLERAEDVDLKLARQLIDAELAPILAPYANQLTAVPSH